jgi:hypothetical protein
VLTPCRAALWLIYRYTFAVTAGAVLGIGHRDVPADGGPSQGVGQGMARCAHCVDVEEVFGDRPLLAVNGAFEQRAGLVETKFQLLCEVDEPMRQQDFKGLEVTAVDDAVDGLGFEGGAEGPVRGAGFEQQIKAFGFPPAGDQIEIDMVQMSGPDFEQVDNRLLSLQLVKNGMTDAVIFSPDGRNIQAADILYKKNIVALRGSFRPVTKVNIDMIMKGFKIFEKEYRVDQDNIQVLFEITLNNLRAEGDIDEQDFLDRADILCSLGQTVLVSNYSKYYKLVEFFTKYSSKRMGIIMGTNMLMELFNEKYYRDLNGGILEAFGILFSRDLKIYLYPFRDHETGELLTSKNCPIHPRLKPLYDYLIFNKRLVDITDYNAEVLDIYSKDVLDMIQHGYSGWEELVPAYVDTIIKENRLFGYDASTPVNPNYTPPIRHAKHKVNPN